MTDKTRIAMGIDVGTECVKAAVLDGAGNLMGSGIVPRLGYFQDRVTEAYALAADDAQVDKAQLASVCATGFADNCVPMATTFLGEAASHALGAFHQHQEAMCIVDIGGRDPKVIQVDARGRPTGIHTLRRCAAGIGTFLNFAARHLDVHPSRLQEMATMATHPAAVGSYCSTFSGQDILERLREGASREEVALGCIHSIADRVVEIGNFQDRIHVTGGVAEYFPGVLKAMAQKAGIEVTAIPNPILAGAVGAALWALRTTVSNLCEQGEA